MPTFISAKLYDAGGDLSKQWFVFYSVADGRGNMKRVKASNGINRHKTDQARRAAAAQLIFEINRKLQLGQQPSAQNGQPLLFLSQFDAVLQLKKRTTKRSTWRNYLYVRDLLLEFFAQLKVADVELHEFTPAMAFDFRNFLLIHPARKSGKTIHNYETYLKSIFAELVRAEKIPKNPYRNLRPLKFISESRRVFTNEHREMILKHCDAHEPQLALFIRFLFFTLNRPNAIRLLKIQDLEMSNKRVRFSASDAKNGKTGFVVMPSQLNQAIIESGILKYHPSSFIFAQQSKPGRHARSRDYFRQKHADVLKILGISADYKLYAWKDTGAVMLYEALKDLKRVSEQCLHSDVLVTMKYLKRLGVLFGNGDLEEKYPDI